MFSLSLPSLPKLQIRCGLPRQDSDAAEPLLSEILEEGTKDNCSEGSTNSGANGACKSSSKSSSDRSQGEEPVAATNNQGEEPQKQPAVLEGVTCFGLFCARLSCSWMLKLLIFFGMVVILFAGELGRPMWIPISLNKACQFNNDVRLGSRQPPMVSHSLKPDVHACFAFCEGFPSCQAVDYYSATKWCTAYAVACVQPTDTRDGASSYQIAEYCRLYNGTEGVIVGGECTLGIHVPTVWGTVHTEGLQMFLSPRNWLCSLTVALLYTYLTSSWVQEKTRFMRPIASRLSNPFLVAWRWMLAGGVRRKAVVLCILCLAWAVYTWETIAHPTCLGGVGMSWRGKAWCVGSLLLLLVVTCSAVRSILVGVILAVGGWFMSIFTALATFALSACFDMSALGITSAAGALTAGGTAAAATDAAVAAEGTAAITNVSSAVEAVSAADAAVATDAAVAMESVAGAEATIGAAAAAEAATAAEAAAATEAAIAADSVAAAALLCTIQ